MLMLTQDIKDRMPRLYATEDTLTAQKVVQVKFFTPDSNWTWYAIEADAVLESGEHIALSEMRGRDDVIDVLFFGLVDGFELEWGEFTLSELEDIHGPMNLKIERDMYFGTPMIGEVLPGRYDQDSNPSE